MTPLFGLSARSTNHKSLSARDRRVFDRVGFVSSLLLLLPPLFFLSRFKYISVASRGSRREGTKTVTDKEGYIAVCPWNCIDRAAALILGG